MAYAYKYKTKKKKELWRVVYGYNQSKRGFSTKKEALEYGKKMEGGLDKDNPIADKTANEKMASFKEMADLYMAQYKVNVTEETYRKTESILNKSILPNIRNKSIEDFTKAECMNFRLVVSKMQYSTSHKNRILNIYRNIFQFAVEIYDLEGNPAQYIKNIKKTSEEKMNAHASTVWTPEEFGQFIKYVDEEVYRVLFITLYMTGIRFSECLSLKWSDFNNVQININKSLRKLKVDGEKEYKDPKTNSSFRNVPIPPSLYSLLEEYKEKQTQYSDFSEDWYIFGGPHHLARETIRRRMKKAVNLSGVKDIRIHDFRGSYATNLADNHIAISEVKARLGHSNIATTLSYYVATTSETRAEANDYLEGMMSNMLLEEFEEESSGGE